MLTSTPSFSHVCDPVSESLADYPALQRMRRALRSSLTRVWPTRRLPLCPPAVAALLQDGAQELPTLVPAQARHSLVIFVPVDVAPHLHALAATQPNIRVQPDVSLQREEAYLSWSVSKGAGQLPLAIWLKAADVSDALSSGARFDEQDDAIPVIWVAGETVVAGSLVDCSDLLQLCLEAWEYCETTPRGCSAQELAQAQVKAEKYSERPWLFMRYELKNSLQRMAVHWAPVRRMHSKNQEQDA